MGDLFGAVIFLIVAALAIMQKVKQFREEEEVRRAAGDRPRAEDLPEETRRMLYGDRIPTATLDEEDEDEPVAPIPVATEDRHRRTPPRPQQQRSYQRPSPPHREVVIEQPRRSAPQRPAQRQAQSQPPPIPKRHETRAQLSSSRERELQEARQRLERARKMQKRYSTGQARSSRRSKKRSSADLLKILLRHPDGVRAGIIFSEVLGPPKSMR